MQKGKKDSGRPPTNPRRIGRCRILEPFKELIRIKSTQGLSPTEILQELRSIGYFGSLRTLQRHYKTYIKTAITTKQQKMDWLHLVSQGAKTAIDIKQDIGGNLTDSDIATLLECIKLKPQNLRNRALALIAHANQISPGQIALFLCITSNTVRKYIFSFRDFGVECVLDMTRKKVKKSVDPHFSAPIFSILHSPPSAFGFNRTTWRMDDLYATLQKEGVHISRFNIRKTIKNAGYRFRKAKKVLTSTDPNYREKLIKITQILSTLQPDEKFFSIDEFGPFAIRLRGGCSLTKNGETRVVPQWQKNKGSVIATAALELSTNQITHFYSTAKNTDEMIKMLDLLISKYRGQSRIYFSWDAASWHGSKIFIKHINEVNELDYRIEHDSPVVELAPLPSCAQFLNVIESVFSGMARAIIHNSDYPSVEAAKTAIDRYFSERNSNFQNNPKKAGNKIWGKELVNPEFNETNNCKDPRW